MWQILVVTPDSSISDNILNNVFYSWSETVMKRQMERESLHLCSVLSAPFLFGSCFVVNGAIVPGKCFLGRFAINLTLQHLMRVFEEQQTVTRQLHKFHYVFRLRERSPFGFMLTQYKTVNTQKLSALQSRENSVRFAVL